MQTIEDDPNDLIRIGRDPAIALDDGGAIDIFYHYHDVFGIYQYWPLRADEPVRKAELLGLDES